MVDYPLVSIGLPVYNEAEFIRSTIESILAQSYKNFELIISDNCSTDDTYEICQHYAVQDARIQLHHNAQNIGGADNAPKTLALAQGEYFVWIAGHDRWHPDFLQECVSTMEDDPEVVLCHPQTVWIDTADQELGVIGRSLETRGLNQLERFQVVLWGMGYGSPIYGLMRTQAVRQVKLGLKVVGPDNIFLNELSLLGTFAYLHAPLQYIRKMPDYGSWEHYIQKLTNRQLSNFSAAELFWQMIHEYLGVIYRHVPNLIHQSILATAVGNCTLFKYQGVLSGLAQASTQASPQDAIFQQSIDELFQTLQTAGDGIAHIWQQHPPSSAPLAQPVQTTEPTAAPPALKVVVDGVFFQLYNTGIARVWESLLTQWVKSGFASCVVVLDRAGTAPQIPGVTYRPIPAYDVEDLAGDRQLLQEMCDIEGADLFMSTYYTTPITTPSVFMVYDMIPEVMGWNLEHPNWRGKVAAIERAAAYTTISANSAQDLLRFHPSIAPDRVTVTYCGVSDKFAPASPPAIQAFKAKYGIRQPYFLITGGHHGYKNTILFFQAFAQLTNSSTFDIVCTSPLPEEYRQYTLGSTVHCLRLADAELRYAYAGAIALVYPSLYEGFGLPVVEALASGCPVITTPTSSLPEVAGTAAIYVAADDVSAMANALCEVQKPSVRQSLVEQGFTQASGFSWATMAQQVQDVLLAVHSSHLSTLPLQDRNLVVFPDWSMDEELLGQELAEAIGQLVQDSSAVATTLLLDTSNATNAEQVEFMLGTVAMQLMMNDDLDLNEYLDISPIRHLSAQQWQQLAPHIDRVIALSQENNAAKSQLLATGIPLPAELRQPVNMAALN